MSHPRPLTSRRIGLVGNSLTLEISSKAAELKAAGKDVVAFAAGEPDFDAPPHVKAAGIKAINDGKGRYTAAMGLTELRKLVAKKFVANGFPYTVDNVIVSSGAKHALYNALYAFCDPGDEVLFASPYWNSYPDMVRAVEGVPVAFPTRIEDNYEIDAEALRRAISPRSRCLIINSPNNPTGAVYSRASMEKVAKVVRDAGLVVICDDIYEHLVYADAKYVSLLHVAPDLAERVVVINGLSKSHCMTGWRAGYAGGPKEVIEAMGRFQSQATSHASAITQIASMAALEDGGLPDPTMIAEYDRRRRLMHARLNAMPGVNCPEPKGAFYALPDISAHLGKTHNGRLLRSAADVAALLLGEDLVATIPGDSFGAPSNLRFAYTCSYANIEKGLDRVGNFFAKLG